MKKILITFSVLICLSSATIAQTSKKTWMLGGSASYSSTKEGEVTSTDLEFQPGVGYFFANNFAAGINFDVFRKAEGESEENKYAIDPFIRYYFASLAKNAKVFASAQAVIGNELEDAKNNLSGWGLDLGSALFVTKNLALETTVGYTSTKGSLEDVRDNTVSVKIGFRVHL